ncbi:RHS repeat protein, partial [Frankia sp. CNm7]
MALLLVPVLVMTGVSLVVYDRVTSPGLVPISEQNPFKDVDLPESSDGSIGGDGEDEDEAGEPVHQVPTSATSVGGVPDPAAVRAQVGEVAGAVPVTPDEEPREVRIPPGQGEVQVPQVAAGAEVPAQGDLTVGAREPGRMQAGRVEVESARTGQSTVFANPDGTFTTEVSAAPVRFKDRDGRWVDIDTRLAEQNNGRLRPRAAQAPVEIAAAADDPELARVELGAGVSVGFGLDGAAGSAGRADEAKVVFAGVREQADLELSAANSGLKEVIVLRSAGAPTSWAFPLRLQGLTASLDASGQVVLAGRDGKAVAVIPRGWMEDGAGAVSDGVTYQLVEEAGKGQVLRVELDADWLSAPERVFPVRVDPTVTALSAAADDTYVSSATPSTAHLSDASLRVGLRTGGDVNHAYLRFPNDPALANANILSATVSLYNEASHDACDPHPVSLHQVAAPWNGLAAVWPGPAVGDEVAQSSFSHQAGNGSCGAGWETFSDPRITELVEDWNNGSQDNHGLSVRASTTDSDHYKEFASKDCACSAPGTSGDHRPKMSVTWSPYDADYAFPSGSAVWEQPVTATQEGRIKIRVTNHGAETWRPNGDYKLSYHVFNAAGTTLITDQGKQTDLPSTVGRGQFLDVTAVVDELPAGSYLLKFDMQDVGATGNTWFSGHGVSMFPVGVTSGAGGGAQVTGASPDDLHRADSLRPTLSLNGSQIGMTYEFQICTNPDAASGACWASGSVSGSGSTGSWQPPAGALTWSTKYYWRGRASFLGTWSAWTPPIGLYTEVKAPVTSRHFGADPYVPSVASVTPLIGNYTSSTTDVTVAGVGPPAGVTRTYNSRNPYVGMFGEGWTSQWDMNVKADDAGEGSLVVRYPDGREGRFGRNWDGSYVSQDGQYALVQAPSPKIASFTGANSISSLGTTDTGETWEVLSGTWGINSNNAYLATAAVLKPSVAVLPAPPDGLVRFTAPTAQDNVGVAFRVQDVDNLWALTVKPSTNSLVLVKRVGGTTSTAATFTGVCCAANDVFAVRMVGSTLTVYRNDRVVGTHTDSALSTATKAGLYATGIGSGRIGSVTIVSEAHRDVFTSANSSTTLGTTDDGETWKTSTGLGAGTWGISSNQAYLATASGNRNVATVPAAADGAFTFKLPVAQAGLGLAFRYADADNYWRLVAQPSSGTWQLVKRVAGTETLVATSSSGLCCTASDTLKVITYGESIIVQRNGTQILSASDPAVFYGSRAGPFAEATGAGRFDEFTATAATTLTDKSGTAHTFRSDGRLARITDVSGNQLELTWDSNAKLTTVANLTTARSLSFTWTGTHVTSVSTQSVAAHGGPVTWTYAYTGDKLTSVTAPHSANPTQYRYAGNGKLDRITLPKGNVDMEVGYNSPDDTVAWKEDGEGNRTTYTRLTTDTDPTTIVRVTDPKDHDQDWEYDNGQLVSVRDEIGERSFVYNDRGFLYQVIDENGNMVQTDTDDHGNVLTRSRVRSLVDDTDLEVISEFYEYYQGSPGDPRNDSVLVYRDGRSGSPTDNTFATTNQYDSYGQLIGHTTPATDAFPSGRTETWVYSTGTEAATGSGGTVPRGLLLTHTDPRGKTTTFGYDVKGDLRREQDPAGLVHTYTYDELGRQVTSTEISDTFPAGLTTTTAYTKLGWVAQVTQPGVENLITSVVHTPVTTNSYDANGNLIQVTVSDSTGGDTARVTEYSYDDADREIYRTDGAGSFPWSTYATTYDPNGNVATSTDPNGTVTAYTYTVRNLLAMTVVEDFVDDPVAGSAPHDEFIESRAYDPAGRLASVTDEEGRVTRHTYYLDDLPYRTILQGYRPPDLATGQLSEAGAYDLVLAEHHYDRAGNETSTIAAGGLRTTSATYAQDGSLESQAVDPEGLHRWTAHTYDAAGNPLLDESGADGTSNTRRTEYTYDDANRLATTTVFGDGSDRFTSALVRDQRGFVVSSVDPRGYVSGGPPDPAYVTDLVTDARGNVVQTIHPPVQVEQNGGSATTDRPSEEVGYNTFGEVTHVRDARNQVTVTAYDHLGRVTQKTYPSYTPPGGGSPIVPTEQWYYDDNNNPTIHIDTRGQTTTIVYDKRDRPVAVTEPQASGAPSAGVTRTVYDDAGNVISTVDQLGAWTFHAYDDLDREWATTTTERSPLATFNAYTVYNDAGDVVRVVKPSNVATGASVISEYNGAGDLVAVTDELGKTTTRGYDHVGRLVSTTDPLGRETRTTYDRAGRTTAVAQYSPTDTLLRTTTTGYDAAGNVTSATDPNGHTTTATFDALNQRRALTVPVSSGVSITSSAGYDVAGNRTRLTDGNANSTIYTFNSLGLPEKTIEPSTPAYPNLADRTWQATYDASGLPTTLLEPGGVTRTATYDELGRRTVETGYGTGTTGAARALEYDLAGNLVEIDIPAGSIPFTYNDRGLPTSAGGGASTFVYDEDGRMIQRGDTGTWSNYSYDARGNLVAAGPAAAGGTRLYSYDDASQLVEIDYDGDTGAVRNFTYDDLGRLATDTLTGPGGTLRAQSYAYDDNDNITSSTISPGTVAAAGTHTYTYDWADRLTSWTDPASTATTYGWDAAGNRTSVNSQAATFDARNRLTSDGAATYLYTARGTMSSRTAGSTVTTFGFDAFDRLVSHTAGPVTTDYTYDGLDRIATRNTTENFVYDGLEKEPGVDGTSAYARGPAGELLGTGTAGGDWATLENQHGDIVAAFTIDGTALTDDRAYDPFGAPIVAGDPNLRIGYQGSWTDPDTGLVNAQARWYNPATATFLSRDTAALPWTGTPADNRYTYAAANPITYNDPTGFRVDPDAEMRQSVAEANRKAGRTDMKCNAIGQCAPGKAPAIVRGKP